MKKLIVILMSLLLLCGCAAQEAAEEPSAATEQTQAPTQEVLVSLYDAKSAVEQQTGGAVRAYPLGDGYYPHLVAMGDKLLVVSSSGDITLLQGEKGEIVATVATDLVVELDTVPIWASSQGMGYYAQQTGEVVLLDGSLLEIARIRMPENAQGVPSVLLQRNEIFYCTPGQIHAMDIQTGISRLVRSHQCTEQILTGGYFNDTILGCRITDQQGVQKDIYLYAETGEVVAEDATLGTLHTQGADYFALRADGAQTQVLFGNAEGETMCLDVAPEGLQHALVMGGAVRSSADESGVTFELYDFASGKRSAQVTLEGLSAPTAVTALSDSLWFIIDQTLYRWDPTQSPTQDDTNYVSQLYTQQNPDTQGLAQCQSRVEELKTTYGIDLRIWTDAVADTDDYGCEVECRVSSIEKALDGLETRLKQLPEGFLSTTGSIRVSIVHSVNGAQTPALFWQGSTCCMLLPSEVAEKGFLWGFGCAIDVRVLGNSRELDNWDKLNPRGFEYTYDYAANAEREDADDYQDDFVDQIAMSFPTEDRARVFMAAMLPDNAELFSQDTLQDKLLCLCEGIREAYNAEDDTQVYPWEQYLEEPIAAEEDE